MKLINIEKATSEFDKYAKKYDLTNFNIKLKYHHSYRVMKYSENIARSISLSEEEVNISKIIGLLHDIARFEQYTIYHTFADSKSIDHGDLGVEILKKDNFLRNFVKEDIYDEIILKAIKNHNKYIIEENLPEKTLIQSKIIRDADKLDIFYELLTIFYKEKNDIEEIENSIIEEESINRIEQKKLIKRNSKNSAMDRFLINFCFVFDLNYTYSFKEMKEKNYINKIIDKFEFKNNETKEKMEIIRKILNQYIDEKIKGE